MSKYTLEMVVGDRDTWSFRIYDEERDNDLASATCTLNMYNSAGTLKITAGSMTAQPGITFTADSTSGINRLKADAHGLQDGWEVVLSTSGTIPPPFVVATRYFIRDRTPNSFRLSLEPNGAPIVLTGNGTATNTLKCYGHCTYAPAAIDVDTAGTYKAWITRTIGGKAVTFPDDKEGIAVVINAVP